MLLDKFMISEDDAWTWKPALGTDVEDIVDLGMRDFGEEVTKIFTLDRMLIGKNVSTAIVTQLYNPHEVFFIAARHRETNELVAYAWAVRSRFAEYSYDEMTEMRFIHIDQSMSARQRITICAQILNIWHDWAKMCGVDILFSGSLLKNQQAFLHLHEQAGFVVNGSASYLRVIPKQNEASNKTSQVLESDPVRD